MKKVMKTTAAGGVGFLASYWSKVWKASRVWISLMVCLP